MKKTEWKSPALLFLTAVVWGVAFVAQSVGMDYVGPFTFNCIRCLIGAVVLVPCIWFLDGWKQRPDGASCGRESARASCGRESTGAPSGASYGSHALLAGGICCGLALFVASNLQQIGIQYTTVGKAGFITALYIVMVPVFGIFLKKRAGIRVWVSVALAVAGLYLLCITDRLALGKGDILVLLCAVVFAVHILVVDHFSAKADGVRMSCIQFLVCGLLSGVCMLITEHPEMRSDLAGMAADPLCGCLFLRRGLYPADCRTKGNRSDSGISDPEPGIGRLGAGWLAAARTALKCEGAWRLRADVCGDFAGAAAGATAILSRQRRGLRAWLLFGVLRVNRSNASFDPYGCL